jgi:hypothetical protein
MHVCAVELPDICAYADRPPLFRYQLSLRMRVFLAEAEAQEDDTVPRLRGGCPDSFRRTASAKRLDGGAALHNEGLLRRWDRANAGILETK